MKKIFSNYRYYVLTLLSVATILGVFAVPNEDLPLASFVWTLFSTKAFGFGAGFLFHRLFVRWEERGAIDELTKFVNEF